MYKLQEVTVLTYEDTKERSAVSVIFDKEGFMLYITN